MHVRREQYKFQQGSAAAIILMILVPLALLPLLSMSSGPSTNQLLELNKQDKYKDIEYGFTMAVFAALRSSYVCTENLKQMGKIGQPVDKLDNLTFLPHMMKDNGPAPTLQPTDFMTGPNNLSVFLGQEFKLKRAYLEKYEKRSATTYIFKYRLDLVATNSKFGIHAFKPTELLVLVGTDAAGSVQGCQLSRFAQGDVTIEDKICQALHGSKSTFDMGGHTCT
jgi:hypothetical protein